MNTARERAMDGTAMIRRRMALVTEAKRKCFGEIIHGVALAELDRKLRALDAPCIYPPRGNGKHVKPFLPCVVCGDPAGRVPKKCRRPTRVDVTRFGVPGEACKRCYDSLRAPGRRVSRAETTAAVEKLLPPRRCADCGMAGGGPIRRSGRGVGVEGFLHANCYFRLHYHRKLSAAARRATS